MSSELKSLGRYQIKGVLGQGAMGLVYDGHDPKLNRRVAIKTILTKKLSPDQAKMATVRFEREVKAVARLNHRNIVQVYDFGNEADLAYIVMEYIKGKELKDFLDGKERFDLRRVFALMEELLDALHMAHEVGIIHRDVKPANIMVDAAGHAKLTDFGVARVTEGDGSTAEATRAGTMVGTPSYMSPEQITGQQIDRRSDIFSAGIIFYQLLTWKKPFEGAGQWDLAKKIVEDDPVWPSTIVTVPPEVDRILAKALAKEPERRYATARKFVEAMQRVAAGKAPEEPGEAVVQPGVKAKAAAQAAAVNAEADQEFWEAIEDSNDPDELGLYLEQFPNGAYVEQAKKKIAALQKK